MMTSIMHTIGFAARTIAAELATMANGSNRYAAKVGVSNDTPTTRQPAMTLDQAAPVPAPALADASDADRAIDYLRCERVPEHLLDSIDPDLAIGVFAFKSHCGDRLHGRITAIDASIEAGFVSVAWTGAGELCYPNGQLSAQAAQGVFEAIAASEVANA
jgi:hypothetical protein